MNRPTNCDGCGACCLRQNLLPMTARILDKSLAFIPKRLGDELDAVAGGMLFGDDGCPCVWLDRGG